jgi:chromosomal replication initiation ATPase DnaA
MLSGKGAHFWQDFRDRLVIGSNETIRSLLRTNPPAGKPQSVPQFTSLARSQVDVDKELDRLCKAFAVSRQELRLKKRNGIPRMAAYFHLVENCGLSVAETASKLEVGSSAVSNGISKLRQLMSSDNYLEKKIKSLSVK